MMSEKEVKERLVEIIGMIRRLEGKEALGLDMSCEEYEVFDNLCAEKEILEEVLFYERDQH